MQQLPLSVRLRERASFEYFHPGANVEIVERLRAVSAGGRAVLWLWGREGSGRSHLLQAVCAAAVGRRCAYLPLGELGPASRAFLEDSALLELLCIDDIELLVGRRELELAIFSAYRSLEERGGALVIAAATPPSALDWSLADIRSRLSAAEVFQLKPLDEHGELAALRLRASARGLELPEETARYLLRRFPRDMSTLGRLLDDIDLAALSAQRRLTVPFVKTILGES
jgi:DnaA family protein